jgi:hypothetical protein
MRIPALLVTALFSCASAWAAAMPEFGASVSFAKGEEPATIAGLRGKVAIVIFFQTWCPICNKWAPEMLKQLEESYAGQPGYVLVALKTDGGTVEEGRDFLAAKGVHPERWLLAADGDAAYYQRAYGATPLWGYAVVSPTGERVEAAKAGSFWSKPGAQEFVLPSKRKQFDAAYAASVKPALPADRQYGPELAHAVQLAETGRLASALAEARGKSGLRAKELETDLLALIDRRLAALEATARDAGSSERFPAFMAMRTLIAQLKGLPQGKAGMKTLAELSKDKAIQREQRAETAWEGLQAAVEKQPKEKRQEALRGSIPAFTKAHEGTHFARVAEETLQAPAPAAE